MSDLVSPRAAVEGAQVYPTGMMVTMPRPAFLEASALAAEVYLAAVALRIISSERGFLA